MNILYGVNGEGLGHAMRSVEIIKPLLKENNVKIVTGGRALDYLKKIGSLKKVSHLSFVTKNGKIKYRRTALLSILKFPFFVYHFLSILISSIIKRPNVIITDFEPITAYVGFILRIPVISFDNQHIVTDTKIPKVVGVASRLFYKTIVYFMIPFPRKKIITGFFYPKVSGKNAVLINPVVREMISKQKVKKGERLLVYLSLGDDSLLKELNKLKERCIVYSKTNLKSTKYLKIRKFNEKEFAKDLANSKAVICNAGMTTLSESIYLKKPVLCIPLKGHMEQELNAYYIQERGYGVSREKINDNVLREFLKNLSIYENNLRKTDFSNKDALKIIEKSIKEVTS